MFYSISTLAETPVQLHYYSLNITIFTVALLKVVSTFVYSDVQM